MPWALSQGEEKNIESGEPPIQIGSEKVGIFRRMFFLDKKLYHILIIIFNI